MSLAYYIVLNDKEPDFDDFVNGKAVAHAVEALDEVCAKAGLPRLDSFAGQSCEELSEMLGDDFDDADERQYSDEKWFDAEEGISWMDALVVAIGQYPKIIPDPDEIIEELKIFKSVLEQAKTINAKWHFAIDF